VHDLLAMCAFGLSHSFHSMLPTAVNYLLCTFLNGKNVYILLLLTVSL
jgi:hypothetical protein